MVAMMTAAKPLRAQVAADFGADALDPHDLGDARPVGFVERGFELGPDAADVLHGLEAREERLPGLAEILNGDLTEIERSERLLNRLAVGLLAELDLRNAAADEIDAVVEALGEQQHDREDIDRGRECDEEITLPDEVEIDVGTD